MSTRTDFRGLNGHDVLGARRNRQGETVYVTRPGDMPRLGWVRRQRDKRGQRGRPGDGMIGVATLLLFLLGAGLLGVSLAAQYAYLLRERHQHTPALIEALALDVGMLIFSLLALGLARSGKSARIERTLIVACAAGSAVMNFAAANDASLRSVLAYCMPPVFLAVVADRVISVVRRHYLGEEEHSAWSGLGRAALYGLRFTVAAPSTLGGARRALLTATPLPAIEAPRAQDQATRDGQDRDAPSGPNESHSEPVPGPGCVCPLPYAPGAPVPCVAAGRCMRPTSAAVPPPPREGTKTAAFLRVVEERQGPLAGISLDAVGAFSAKYAPDVDLHPGSARSALRAAILAARQEDGAR